MQKLTISCESCERIWCVAAPFTLYEQHALESCPCPHCGAYTLCCQDPETEPYKEKIPPRRIGA